jgi:hypothetical protein
MYLTNKYYDNTEIGDCGGDHDGWILNTLLLCRVKSGAKQQKVDPTSNPNVDQASGMLAKSQV